eukprot:Pgem_evm1s12785
MPKIKKGARVYVLAKHFVHEWCVEQSLNPERKLSGTVERKLKYYCKVKMGFDGETEEVDIDKACFYGITPGGYTGYSKKRQKQQKNNSSEASTTANSQNTNLMSSLNWKKTIAIQK